MKREGEIRIPSGCAISAVISREGRRMTGEAVMKSLIPMHDRSNGLGGGFAAYGIYPEYRELYGRRKATIERVFADAKEKHAMRYTQYRGLAQVTDWMKLKFAAMNLKKLAMWK